MAKRIFLVAAVVVVLLLIGTGVFLKSWLDTGIAKYQDVKLAVAEVALKKEAGTQPDGSMPWLKQRLYVAEVRPITAGEKSKNCPEPELMSDSPRNVGNYVVVVERQKLFERPEKTTYYSCKFLRYDPGL